MTWRWGEGAGAASGDAVPMAVVVVADGDDVDAVSSDVDDGAVTGAVNDDTVEAGPGRGGGGVITLALAGGTLGLLYILLGRYEILEIANCFLRES